MAFEDWKARFLNKTRPGPVPVPSDCAPPFFVTAPTMTQLHNAMKAIGWPRVDVYGDYLTPDGRTAKIAYKNGDLNGHGPGTLFVFYGRRDFQRDRERMIDGAHDKGWRIEPLPERTP